MTALLITVDVEIARDRDGVGQMHILERLRRDLNGLPVTWFCTATAAEAFAPPLRRLLQRGDAIGCHGLDHGAWEDYRRLDRVAAHRVLQAATLRIEAALGQRPRLFRGPRMTTSQAVRQALATLGYQADLSICAYRWDALTASGWQLRWLLQSPAPFLSDEGLAIVPLSGHGLPFVSGLLYLAGLPLTYRFARHLCRQAEACGAPLVYLFHSYEFAAMSGRDRRPWHHRLYQRDAEARYDANLALLRRLVADGLQPLTAMQYLGGSPHEHRAA